MKLSLFTLDFLELLIQVKQKPNSWSAVWDTGSSGGALGSKHWVFLTIKPSTGGQLELHAPCCKLIGGSGDESSEIY